MSLCQNNNLNTKIKRPTNNVCKTNIINNEINLSDQFLSFTFNEFENNGGVKIYRGGIAPNALLRFNEENNIWECGLENNLLVLNILGEENINNSFCVINFDGAISTNNSFYKSGNIMYCDRMYLNSEVGDMDNSAIFQSESNSKGMLLPRLTYTQKMSIPILLDGLTVYDTSYGAVSIYSVATSEWKNLKKDEHFIINKSDALNKYKLSINKNNHSGSNISMTLNNIDYKILQNMQDYNCFGKSCFDGRYIYMPRYLGNGVKSLVVRYDTLKNISDNNSYSHFDLDNVVADFTNIISCYFDGRYIYFLRDYSIESLEISTAVIIRYDISKSFYSISSYEISCYLPYTQNNNSPTDYYFGNYIDAIKNDKYIYFFSAHGVKCTNYPPTGNTYEDYSFNILRYNTQQNFTNAGSFEIINLYNNIDNDKHYSLLTNACSDGRYIYFSAYFGVAEPSLFVSYDTTLSINDSNAYNYIGGLDSYPFLKKNISNAIYDGKYVYFMRTYNNFSSLARYNTLLPINNLSSYEFVSIENLPLNPLSQYKIYQNIGFDGKYIYIVPGGYISSSENIYTLAREVIKYNTTKKFLSDKTTDLISDNANTSSFTIFNMGSIVESVHNFSCCIYAHQYMYFIPKYSGEVGYDEVFANTIDRLKAYAEDTVSRELGSNISIASTVRTRKIKNILELRTESNKNILFNAVDGVSIGQNAPNENAILDIQSTTKGLLLPRLTTDISASSTNNGAIWYSNTSNTIKMCVNGTYATIT